MDCLLLGCRRTANLFYTDLVSCVFANLISSRRISVHLFLFVFCRFFRIFYGDDYVVPNKVSLVFPFPIHMLFISRFSLTAPARPPAPCSAVRREQMSLSCSWRRAGNSRPRGTDVSCGVSAGAVYQARFLSFPVCWEQNRQEGRRLGGGLCPVRWLRFLPLLLGNPESCTGRFSE